MVVDFFYKNENCRAKKSKKLKKYFLFVKIKAKNKVFCCIIANIFYKIGLFNIKDVSLHPFLNLFNTNHSFSFMKQYELTFIVDPVLSGDELKAAAQTYIDFITSNGGSIVHVDEVGLRPLAYPINKRASGVYFCVEFTNGGTHFLPKMELTMRRDDRIMRYLTIALDKFGIKYNEDRRAGKIGSSKKEKGAKGKKAGKATDVATEAPAVVTEKGTDPEEAAMKTAA